MHRYSIAHEPEGDFVIWESLCWNGLRGNFWKEHTRWLIPGTQLED